MLGRFALLSCLQALLACRPADPHATLPREEPAPEASPPPAAAAPEAAPAKNDDAEILRAVLTHERFAMYLHPDVAGRVPVVVSGEARPRGPVDLELHGAAVSIVDTAPADAAVVLISTWSIEGDTAHVALGYPIEGVVASFDLARSDAGWRVTEADVAER